MMHIAFMLNSSERKKKKLQIFKLQLIFTFCVRVNTRMWNQNMQICLCSVPETMPSAYFTLWNCGNTHVVVRFCFSSYNFKVRKLCVFRLGHVFIAGVRGRERKRKKKKRVHNTHNIQEVLHLQTGVFVNENLIIEKGYHK